MNDILFLAHRCPFPPDRGDRIRSWNILKALAEMAPVHVIAFSDGEAVPAPLADLCASVNLVPQKRQKFSAALGALLSGRPASVEQFADNACTTLVGKALVREKIGAIYALSGQMAQHVPTPLDGVRFVMDFVDVDSAKFEDIAREKGGLLAVANRFEAARLKKFEADVARRADTSLFVSADEAALFAERSGLDDDRVRAVPNGVDLQFYNPAFGDRALAADGPLIVFTGQMDYIPNIDAVIRFATKVLPRIRAVHPDAGFAIVGRAPVADVRALSGLPGVIVTGAVDDTRPWLARAEIVVAPLQIGRGVQNKVLEAMAMGKPVIASAIAAQGLAVAHGSDLEVADSVEDLSDRVIALLSDSERRTALGLAARRCVEMRYDWGAALADLPDILGLERLEAKSA